MKRALTTQNLFDIKHDVFELEGIWKKAMGEPERHGSWMIWGREKNGKTWFALLLAQMLSGILKVHYISAEEGTGKAFVDSLRRARINPFNEQIQWQRYESIETLYVRLKKRGAPKIVVIDNITVYTKELNNGKYEKLLKDFPDVLFIFLAHEEKGEPYTASAKLVKKLSKLIFYVEGLTVSVSGRVEGCKLTIDEERAALIYGQKTMNAI
ncbi:hypothetical protein [Mucilaginibacter glaciei]|uniref:AAA+ ATPase domain-containing protein n=1 Tax=Mucilaginibacter glaciei TaxID=2772109 RepID=A0A926NS09_9SPHI|nr:hypothetical protein [Mucilaginibacter glaciei]MBD1394293.1 hypothetical protein [Mucilaginibacter glaciei]